MATHPGAILLQWFASVPPAHAQYIAHLYLMCTAKDMGPFFLDSSAALNEFRNGVLKEDMPVRLAARMVATIATVSFLLTCIEQKDPLPMGEIAKRYSKVVDIAGALWQKTVSSWYTFVHQEFSPAHIVALCKQRIQP